MTNIDTIINDLKSLGIRDGDTLLVHSSFKSINLHDITPGSVIECLIKCVGNHGTLIMPSLSYSQKPRNIHDVKLTPSNVGVMSEIFRTSFSTKRSLHPTHSVCAMGHLTEYYISDHYMDRTPCGAHSPFRKLLFANAKILMLGCGLRPNTTMHAVEEVIGTPYLFGGERVYSVTDINGITRDITYRDHGFDGWEQRYDRIASILDIKCGKIGNALSHLIDTQRLFNVALSALKNDRLAFVAKKSAQQGDAPEPATNADSAS